MTGVSYGIGIHAIAKTQRVSPSSSPSNGPSSGPCASITLARVLRSSASSTCLRSTRPRFRNPIFALKWMDWRTKPTMPRLTTSTGIPFHGSGPSGPHPLTMPSTQRCGRCSGAGAGRRRMPRGRWRPVLGVRPRRRPPRRRASPARFFVADCGGLSVGWISCWM